MHFECPFASIRVQAGPAAQRVQGIISTSLQRQTFDQQYYELADLLFAVQFSWPSFIEWDTKFSEVGYRPRIWADPEGLSTNPKSDAVLSILQGLTVAARKAAISMPWPMPAGQFTNRYGADALAELERSGYIARVRTAKEKLQFLSLKDLRIIQRAVSARGAKNKIDLAKRISEIATEEVLGPLLPAGSEDEYILVVGLMDCLGSEWVRRRRQVVSLYLGTVTAFFGNIRGAAYALKIHDRVETLQVRAGCPSCSPFQNRPLEVGLDPLPPYHPGCQCSIFPLSANPARLQKVR